MPKVLISDALSDRAVTIFKDRGVEVDVKKGMKPEELIACIGEYDGLAIRSATKVTADVLNAATNLKVVGRAGIGVDNVDIPAASARGVVVMNTPSPFPFSTTLVSPVTMATPASRAAVAMERAMARRSARGNPSSMM